MKKTLSIGKLRGLSTSATRKGIFAVLALDHRQALLNMMNPQSPDSVTYNEVVGLKSDFIGELAGTVSAVLTDPIYGAGQTIANQSLPGSVGLMLAVEQSGYTGSKSNRISQLEPGWSVEKAKRMGANSIKLLVYYHPDAGESALKQETLVKKVAVDCQKADIPLFLEVLTYSPDEGVSRESKEFAERLPDVLRAIAERLGGMGADVLKLEFPINIHFDTDEEHWYKACSQISEAAPCPWTVLSAGIEFDLFCKQVEIACKAGASGFIAGRAVWKEGIGLWGDLRKDWLKTTATQRLKTLTSIAEQFGKSWRSYYSIPSPIELRDWYKSYEA